MPVTDPYSLFRQTLEMAVAAAIPEPTAMALATADADGNPSVRMVLLKGFDERGFIFYTNLESRKARQLDENPKAALCFFWQPIGRQVRVEGRVERVSDAEADEYHASRARGSQIGAWASRQSRQLANREELLAAVRAIEEQYEGREIPRPEHWSGYRVIPHRIEFWAAGEFRLHDRTLFEKVGDEWRVTTLYP
jgi:pyridoxamine 5'-phosphate oxidase